MYKKSTKVIKILFVLLNLCSVGHYHCPEFTIVSDSNILDICSFAVKYYVKGSVGICRGKGEKDRSDIIIHVFTGFNSPASRRY